MLRQKSKSFSFFFFELGLIFENFDQKVPKKFFLAKIDFVALFWSRFSKSKVSLEELEVRLVRYISK